MRLEKTIFKTISNLLEHVTGKENEELEFRWGTICESGFVPGITQEMFHRIKDILFLTLDCLETHSIATILGRGVRKIECKEGSKYLKKCKHKILNVGEFEGYVIRLAHATENIIEDKKSVNEDRIIDVRNKHRYTFIDGSFKYELTEVQTQNKNRVYELEIEWIDRPKNVSHLFEPVKKILNIISKNSPKLRPITLKPTIFQFKVIKRLSRCGFVYELQSRRGVQFRGTQKYPYDGVTGMSEELENGRVYSFIWENDRFVLHASKRDEEGVTCRGAIVPLWGLRDSGSATSELRLASDTTKSFRSSGTRSATSELRSSGGANNLETLKRKWEEINKF